MFTHAYRRGGGGGGEKSPVGNMISSSSPTHGPILGWDKRAPLWHLSLTQNFHQRAIAKIMHNVTNIANSGDSIAQWRLKNHILPLCILNIEFNFMSSRLGVDNWFSSIYSATECPDFDIIVNCSKNICLRCAYILLKKQLKTVILILKNLT